MSNTLTIMDAINEFKGELDGSGNYIYVGSNSNRVNKGNLQLTFSALNNDSWDLVCYGVQFKGLVKELETNFGRSYSYQQYKFVFKQMTSEAKVKPVFTQAMADAGELPKVGMECLINFPDIDNCWYEYIIDFIGKHTLIASCKDVEERFSHLDDVYIKPIDTRADKEKAIQSLYNYSLDNHKDKDFIIELMEEAYDKGVGE